VCWFWRRTRRLFTLADDNLSFKRDAGISLLREALASQRVSVCSNVAATHAAAVAGALTAARHVARDLSYAKACLGVLALEVFSEAVESQATLAEHFANARSIEGVLESLIGGLTLDFIRLLPSSEKIERPLEDIVLDLASNIGGPLSRMATRAEDLTGLALPFLKKEVHPRIVHVIRRIEELEPLAEKIVSDLEQDWRRVVEQISEEQRCSRGAAGSGA